MSVVDEIRDERERQVSAEGWSPRHDDRQSHGEIASAAAAYAIGDPGFWPAAWPRAYWKPKSRRRDLVRAAALIVAEIERLDRSDLQAAVETVKGNCDE